MTEATLPYDLYGLTGGNPYVHRELDPLKCPTDSERLLGLDGFVRPGLVSDYLRRKIADNEPAFVLIGGRDLTGRTSVANWVLDKYLELREVERRFVLVSLEVKDHEDFRWFSKAMARLWDKAKKVPNLTPEVREALQGNLKVTNTVPYYEEQFQASVHELSEVLTENRKDPYALGFVFEGVKRPAFIATARDIFADSAAVVVFTYADYDHAQTTDAQGFHVAQFDDVLYVHLAPLISQQVCLLAKTRWKDASEREFPFDAVGLEELYKYSPTPIKMVLRRLEEFLDYRLELAAPHGGEWPENHELYMSRHWLITTEKFKGKSP